ncbi:BON domain-containing protein [Ferruginibacter sp. SUN106]|uniref:BON domain-containing protein n=1 Tax=Ferruginibacter sp. SUN106 TaxID=2978348 RepID=UPI003D35EE59
MKLTKVVMGVVVAATLSFASCKPKDGDIKEKVEAAIKADPMLTGAVADVKDGVVTITGEMKDSACKALCEKTIGAIKDVKQVVNNCTFTPPPPPPAPPASLTTVLDAATQQKVKDGLKDIKGVTVTFDGEKAILAGDVSKADRMKIMQMLASAKVKSDVSKLMDKK